LESFSSPTLRGRLLPGIVLEAPPSASYNWHGIYFGGQVGYASADFDFTKGARDLVAEMARSLLVETEGRISELPRLRRADSRGTSYGGFIGYNTQWGEIVVGLEGNYNSMSIEASSSDVIGRALVLSNAFRNDVFITSDARARVTDYATLRGRAGYAAGWLMPYAMAGAAIGRVDYSGSVLLEIFETDVSGVDPPRPGGQLIDSRSERKTAPSRSDTWPDLASTWGCFPVCSYAANMNSCSSMRSAEYRSTSTHCGWRARSSSRPPRASQEPVESVCC
jgi:opacity protein-like surface antigen